VYVSTDNASLTVGIEHIRVTPDNIFIIKTPDYMLCFCLRYL
jgi:hypothetical protein